MLPDVDSGAAKRGNLVTGALGSGVSMLTSPLVDNDASLGFTDIFWC